MKSFWGTSFDLQALKEMCSLQGLAGTLLILGIHALLYCESLCVKLMICGWICKIILGCFAALHSYTSM